MSLHELIIEGVRQNNLKNLTLKLPHNKVIAITGVSGSGKSSLAFDTIFAEGQWRFVESLSTYARLFLEKLDRPDVDAIHNIRPAIALEQKNPVKGSRSTVGTLTEVYDLLRILYSRIATPYCPKCGKEIRKWDTSQIAAELLEHYHEEKAIILFETAEPLEVLQQKGFQRIWQHGEIKDIADLKNQQLLRNGQQHHEVVLDRLVIRDEQRLSDSLEMAWKEGKDRIKVIIFKSPSAQSESQPQGPQLLTLKFSSKNACEACGISVPDPSPILFSFNHPVCACEECKGFGNILIYDRDFIIPNKDLSLSEGAIELWDKPGYKWWKSQMIKGAKKSDIDVKKPFDALSKNEQETIFKGNEHFYGINDFFEELESKRYKLHVRVLLSRYRSPVTCPKCKGQRLSEMALAYKIEGLNIAEVSELSVSKLIEWFRTLDLTPMQRDIAKEALRQISAKLEFLKRVGLDYLTLSRQAKTLSGGEYQRVNLSNQLSSALTGTLYVLDEPTIGLHPRDTERIAEIMRELSNLGNTIITVEHDREIIAASDWVVELGPGGGHLGGDIVFEGPMEKFLRSGTLTARYIKEKHPGNGNLLSTKKEKKSKVDDAEYLTLAGARGHNLKNVMFSVPLKTLTAVTGVSGSGKSSLVIETLYNALLQHFRIEPGHPLPYKKLVGAEHIKGIRLIDQTPIGKTPRSNPLTYLKIFEPVRKLFAQQSEARAHGLGPGHFSFNVPGGRCEACKGEGYQKMEMFFFEDVFVKCEECNGRRYKDKVLRVAYNGKNISEILEMTIDEAYEFFPTVSEIRGKLGIMREIGLGYLRLGQSATTLSGGEAQRLKICAELTGKSMPSSHGLLYILDEPTVGLHHRDVMMLMNIIRKLVDGGNTVIIIEHNLDVVAQADWVIDLGPEGGAGGGKIIFEGTPEELIHAEHSYTGRYLKEYVTPQKKRMTG